MGLRVELTLFCTSIPFLFLDNSGSLLFWKSSSSPWLVDPPDIVFLFTLLKILFCGQIGGLCWAVWRAHATDAARFDCTQSILWIWDLSKQSCFSVRFCSSLTIIPSKSLKIRINRSHCMISIFTQLSAIVMSIFLTAICTGPFCTGFASLHLFLILMLLDSKYFLHFSLSSQCFLEVEAMKVAIWNQAEQKWGEHFSLTISAKDCQLSLLLLQELSEIYKLKQAPYQLS